MRSQHAADQSQLPRDGAAGAAELVGDGVSGEALHAEDADLAEDVVVESIR